MTSERSGTLSGLGLNVAGWRENNIMMERIRETLRDREREREN